MGTAQSQTLYAGRKPNCVRIYDKIAELRMQWNRLRRERERFNAGLQRMELNKEQRRYGFLHVPSFDEFLRWQGIVTSPDSTITRVERQIGGDRIPEEIDTFEKLYSLADFDPFDRMQIISSNETMISPALEHWRGSTRDWLAGRGLQALIDECGNVQHAFGLVTRYGNGNGKRILESLQAFWPKSEIQLSVAQLTRMFRDSVVNQFKLDTYVPGTYAAAL
ncbi:MAG: hypothetical protein AB7O65_10845 [Candidatus Korobacteraceae bacterium]